MITINDLIEAKKALDNMPIPKEPSVNIELLEFVRDIDLAKNRRERIIITEKYLQKRNLNLNISLITLNP